MSPSIKFVHKGNFDNTERLFKHITGREYLKTLNTYAQLGVEALAAATPVDTGMTSDMWYYEIEISNESTTIVWKNSNTNKNVNIALILQYGHGTGTGGYVQGRDYINPAIQPLFDEIADGVWREVTSV